MKTNWSSKLTMLAAYLLINSILLWFLSDFGYGHEVFDSKSQIAAAIFNWAFIITVLVDFLLIVVLTISAFINVLKKK